jgi:hypothetical protein
VSPLAQKIHMKISEDSPFIFCNYCAKSINTRKSPKVCDNVHCKHYGEPVDKNGDLKNV